jgi:glyoxylase-like metal-dependent hydrolase (beta-lactamase superfamily II)
VPLILAALAELGIERDAVDFLFLTHVHLDHAGGAGALMQALPRATAVVHPRGAPHMADPSILIDATRAVYGDELYSQLYGEILPIARERMAIAQDGQRFDFGGRVFESLHTPGHALHHQAFVDYGATCVFTGDTFGVSYREFDTAAGPWIMPTTTPTQFDPAQLKASIVRIMQFRPRRIYLTHYSEVGECARLANDMYDAIDVFVGQARAAGLDQRRMRFEMRSWALASLREHGVKLTDDAIDSVLGKDIELNIAGLAAWLKREGG